MTSSVAELNDLFDLLYNNLANDGASNIDEYEKSMLFTKAQEEVIYNHLQALGNKYQQGAESSDKRLLELAPLLEDTIVNVTTTNKSDFHNQAYYLNGYNIFSTITTVSGNPIINTINNVYVKILNEVLLLNDNEKKYRRQIIPISYGTFERLVSKPGGEPFKKQVWKIAVNGINVTSNDFFFVFNASDKKIIDNTPSIRVLIRGYKKPTPIILENLNGDLNIDGQQAQTDFLLPMLKREIVQRAVEIAKAAYSTDQNGNIQLQNQMTLGQRSE